MKNSFARLLSLVVLAGAATGCKTEQNCEIVERPDPKTGEIRRYCMKGPKDKIIWREDVERLKKINEEEEERLRNEPNGKKELLPPPGKRVVYRQPETWNLNYKRPEKTGSVGH